MKTTMETSQMIHFTPLDYEDIAKLVIDTMPMHEPATIDISHAIGEYIIYLTIERDPEYKWHKGDYWTPGCGETITEGYDVLNWELLNENDERINSDSDFSTETLLKILNG